MNTHTREILGFDIRMLPLVDLFPIYDFSRWNSQLTNRITSKLYGTTGSKD